MKYPDLSHIGDNYRKRLKRETAKKRKLKTAKTSKPENLKPINDGPSVVDLWSDALLYTLKASGREALPRKELRALTYQTVREWDWPYNDYGFIWAVNKLKRLNQVKVIPAHGTTYIKLITR